MNRKKKHSCSSVLMSYIKREGKRGVFVAHTINYCLTGKNDSGNSV